MTTAAVEHPGKGRTRRLVEIALWLIATAAVVGILDLLGVDISGWFSDLWDSMKSVSAGTILVAIVLQTGQTVFAGLSYYGILSAAYPRQVKLAPIVTAYAVGVAMNNFLPANIGTFVTLLMFIALIPAATLGGSIAAYLVQKIFFTIAGAAIYLYLFLSVPGSFDLNLGNITAHPVWSVAIVVGGGFLIAIAVRLFWSKVKKLWAQAREGGAILAHPKRYLSRVFLPSFISYVFKFAVIGVFLAAFAIPVTFESMAWVAGSGSLANVASFTPGAVGITQATNALALDICCNVPNSTAVAYSTTQQLVTTAWNVLFAVILVIIVFGWTGGKALVSTSYEGAKEQVAEQKEARKRKRAEKKAQKEE
jgi:uncharacterized membrane protein YbhN (UPF0104 family)